MAAHDIPQIRRDHGQLVTGKFDPGHILNRFEVFHHLQLAILPLELHNLPGTNCGKFKMEEQINSIN